MIAEKEVQAPVETAQGEPHRCGGGDYKNIKVKTVEYDMSDFIQPCCDKYDELSPVPVAWEKVATSFVEERSEPDLPREPGPAPDGLQCPRCKGCLTLSASAEAGRAKPIRGDRNHWLSPTLWRAQ